MAPHASEERARAVNGWRLLQRLGIGGNAEVWLAVRDDSPPIALKVLKQLRPLSEPYQRFRIEIGILRGLQGISGVLPLPDASLPERPTRESPAWLAMPQATLIRQALGDIPTIPSVVEAVAEIARRLATLAENHHIHHRDIKAENLFKYKDAWCIGDFGLVDYPGKEDLTVPGKRIGPVHYHAPELLNDFNVQSGPADVFSLAKTLWVLATGQTYPLPGYLPADVRQFRISSYATHERTRSLELLIARATHPDPKERPTMRQMAEELEAWLQPHASRDLADGLEAVRDRIREAVDAQINKDAACERRKSYVLVRLEELTERLKEMGTRVADVTSLQPQYGAWSMFTDCPEIRDLHDFPDVSYTRHAALYVSMREGRPDSATLVSGIVLAVDMRGTLHMLAAHVIRRRSTNCEVIWSQRRYAPWSRHLNSKALVSSLVGCTRTLPQHYPPLRTPLATRELSWTQSGLNEKGSKKHP